MPTLPNSVVYPANHEAVKDIDAGYGYNVEFMGLTKREYFAAMESSATPEKFYRKMLQDFNERSGTIRRTAGHPAEVMTFDEIAEVKASWKVVMADALINALNQNQP